MTNVFGPQTAGVAMTLPAGNTTVRYGTVETWVKDCKPDDTGGTKLDAAFFNNIIGNLNGVVTPAGISPTAVGDMTVLYRAIAKLIADKAPSIEIQNTFGTRLGLIGRIW